MVNSPNRLHSTLLNEMCDRLELNDSFRVINPHWKEYTYIPRADGARNRSRIDLFLVSNNIITNDIECGIAQNLQNKLFDHRAILLSFINNGKGKKVQKSIVRNKTLKDDVADYIIFGACAEAHALHANEIELPIPQQREILRKIGQFKKLIRDAGPPDIPMEEMAADNGRNFTENRIRILRAADLCKDDIDLQLLQSYTPIPDPDIFLETLIGMIKMNLLVTKFMLSKK
jgi:hypothetical protein